MSFFTEQRLNPAPFEGFFGHAHDPVLVMSTTGTLVYANQRARDMIPDLSPEAPKLPGIGFSDELRAELEKISLGSESHPLQITHSRGALLFKAWRIEVAPADTSQVMVILMGDSSAALRAKFMTLRSEVAAIESNRLKDRIQAKMLAEETAHLRRMASTDSLTGLATGEALEGAVNAALSTNGAHGGLIFIDLDRFKSVNDEYGHCAGDAVLRAIGARIRKLIRKQDTAGRIGGDELCYWCLDGSPEDVLEIADELRNVIQTTILWSQKDRRRIGLNVGASVGMAFAPRDGRGYSHLKTVADRRMYQEKHLRRLVPTERFLARG